MRNVWVNGVAWPDRGSGEVSGETCQSERPTETGVGDGSVGPDV